MRNELMSDAVHPRLKRSTLWTLLASIGGILAVAEDTASVHAASTSPDVLAAAYAAYVQRDYATEAKLLGPLAEQGNNTAQALLGFMYGHGQGLQEDGVEALRWYRKAAEQGDAGAQSNLGLLYVQGRGTPQDFGKAVKWLRKSADQGLAFGQNNLGAMYSRGLSVPQDYAEAVKWYGKAAEQGYPVAQFNLGQRYSKGQGVPQDDAEAVKWFRKAADQGDAPGQLALGVAYMGGQGVSKDYVQAYMWINLAIAGSFKRAEEIRDSLRELITPAEAEQRAAAWRPAPSPREFEPPLLWFTLPMSAR
jgi:TPR repeat protein